MSRAQLICLELGGRDEEARRDYLRVPEGMTYDNGCQNKGKEDDNGPQKKGIGEGNRKNNFLTRYAKTYTIVIHATKVNLVRLRASERQIKYYLLATHVAKVNMP